MILLDIPVPTNCKKCKFRDDTRYGHCILHDGDPAHEIDYEKRPDWCQIMELDKVYVITTGEYSDYTINAVTLSKERAEKLKRYYSYNCYGYDAEIEEFDINEPCDDLDDLVPVYYVRIYRNDECECRQMAWMHEKTRKLINRNGKTVDDLGDCTLDIDPNAPKRLYLLFEWYGSAKDEEHALKIAQDKRAKLLEKYYFDRHLSIDQTYIKESE